MLKTVEFQMSNGTSIFASSRDDFQNFVEISVASKNEENYRRTNWDNLTLLEQNALEAEIAKKLKGE